MTSDKMPINAEAKGGNNTKMKDEMLEMVKMSVGNKRTKRDRDDEDYDLNEDEEFNPKPRDVR